MSSGEYDPRSDTPQALIALGRRAEGLKLTVWLNEEALNRLSRGNSLSLSLDDGLIPDDDAAPLTEEVVRLELNSGR